MFMAQQAAVFPTLNSSFINEDALFREYYRFLDESTKRYRTASMKALGVTHILVSPVHCEELHAVPGALPE